MTLLTKSKLETTKNHRFIYTKTRDKTNHVEGHDTVTYKVARECHGDDLCSDDFGDQKCVRNKKNNTRFIYTRTRDRISHVQGHDTVTYKVMRECHGDDLCSDDFGDQEYVRN